MCLLLGPDILKRMLVLVNLSIVHELLIETRHKKRYLICIKFNVRGNYSYLLLDLYK